MINGYMVIGIREITDSFVKEVKFGDSVLDICIGAFDYCPLLNKISVEDTSSKFRSEGGVLYSHNMSTMYVLSLIHI